LIHVSKKSIEEKTRLLKEAKRKRDQLILVRDFMQRKGVTLAELTEFINK